MRMSPDELFEYARREVGDGRELLVAVAGTSMLPYLYPGRDSVLLAAPWRGGFQPPAPPGGDFRRDVVPGRIVLAKTDAGVVLHRVMECRGDRVVLMGDHNLCRRETCAVSEVVAVVVAVERDGRYRRPSLARLWRALLPVRRILLALWRGGFQPPASL